MKKMLIGSLSLAAIFAFSGCGDSVKSVEEYQKLSKAELDSMFKECDEKMDRELNPFVPETLKVLEEMEEISEKIKQSRGKNAPIVDFKSFEGYGSVTDEELAKFGNSKYAEFVTCGRIYRAQKNKK